MTDFKIIEDHVLAKLRKGLPGYLTYHNIDHTLDVLKEAVNIAEEEGGINSEDLYLLKTGALYHDTGFVSIYTGHEEKGCEIATNELKGFGFSDKQIDIVCGLIRATRIPQTPHNFLEKIICDADLDYLGRKDFYTIGDGLYKEFLHQGIVHNELEWNQLQVKFLEKHSYFTNACKKKRDSLKIKHIGEVKEKVVLLTR